MADKTKRKSDAKTTAKQEKFAFQAEVSKLLDIVAHSLYSEKEIFLRELISNSSDACDKLRYEAQSDGSLIEGDADYKIILSVDKKAKTITVSDNGIGMNHDELTGMLGTIARSGTQAFVKGLSGDAKKDSNLIGKFGVGFYSSFMVAKRVEVLTRKAGEKKAWLWSSDGLGEFTISEAERSGRGTSVKLFLKKDEGEFLEKIRLENIVKSYSDHISIPIMFEGEDGDSKPLNTASALWTRPKKEITSDQYKEFYHHVGHCFDDPWLILHNRVEGVLSYTNLLFIPSTPPFDMLQPDRKQHVKLYANRVFITDDCEELLPPYFRFLRGIVDSEDLSLNISREMLQNDPRLAKIRSGLIKRILGELKKKAEKKPDEFIEFWNNFGAVLKEGIYDDFENRDKIIEISRFHSTNGDELTSLDDYIGRMLEGQKEIFYIAGDDRDTVAMSPQLEGYRDRGIEVLLMSDPIDEFWVPAIGSYKDKPFKSATRGDADLSGIKAKKDDTEKADTADEEKKETAANIENMINVFKDVLKDQVKDVRTSQRLTNSPVCLVAGEGDMDMHLERMLKKHRQLGIGETSSRILEINPSHPLIISLAKIAENSDKGSDNADISDAAHLLLDQARIVEGEKVADAAMFSRRFADMMARGLSS